MLRILLFVGLLTSVIPVQSTWAQNGNNQNYLPLLTGQQPTTASQDGVEPDYGVEPDFETQERTLYLPLTIQDVDIPDLQSTESAVVAAESICPVFANENLEMLYPTGALDEVYVFKNESREPLVKVPGDLNMCNWSTLSSYGNYVTLGPTKIVSYSSCAEWKNRFQQWVDAGKPLDNPPGLVGHTYADFEPQATVLGRNPKEKGSYMVRISFRPKIGTPNPNLINLWRPTWPGMTATQINAIDKILNQILVHERGHQNLSGHIATAFQKDISIPAKNEKAALTSELLQDNIFLANYEEHLASGGVKIVYDLGTKHGGAQSTLGGVDIPNFNCGTLDLTSTYFRTVAMTSVECGPAPSPVMYSSETNEAETTYLPPPAVYQATRKVSEASCGTVTNATTNVSGTPAISGEDRTYSESSVADNSFTYPSGEVRTLHQEARALLPTRYDEEDGKLSISGAVTCYSQFSDTRTTLQEESPIFLQSSAYAVYRFTVGSTSTFKMKLTGQWPSINRDVSLVAIGQGWADYLNSSSLGQTYTKTLPPGRYELSLSQACKVWRPARTVSAERTGDVQYVVTIEN